MFWAIFEDFGEKFPGQGGRMAITWEPVVAQRHFKAETHSFSKIIGVFEAQKIDPTTPKGGCPVNQVAQAWQ